jgi:hypothetical protein
MPANASIKAYKDFSVQKNDVRKLLNELISKTIASTPVLK